MGMFLLTLNRFFLLIISRTTVEYEGEKYEQLEGIEATKEMKARQSSMDAHRNSQGLYQCAQGLKLSGPVGGAVLGN